MAVLRSNRWFVGELLAALMQIEAPCRELGLDLRWALDLKIAYNCSRPERGRRVQGGCSKVGMDRVSSSNGAGPAGVFDGSLHDPDARSIRVFEREF